MGEPLAQTVDARTDGQLEALHQVVPRAPTTWMRWTGHPRGELAVGGRERDPPQSGRRDLGAQLSGCLAGPSPRRIPPALPLLVRDLERHARTPERAPAADAHHDDILARAMPGRPQTIGAFRCEPRCSMRRASAATETELFGGRYIERLRRIGRGNARRSSQQPSLNFMRPMP